MVSNRRAQPVGTPIFYQQAIAAPEVVFRPLVLAITQGFKAAAFFRHQVQMRYQRAYVLTVGTYQSQLELAGSTYNTQRL